MPVEPSGPPATGPGLRCGKLVGTFDVRPSGAHRSLLTVDTRVQLSDPPSWLKFRQYWRVEYPFVHAAHTIVLRAIADTARQRALGSYRRSGEE